MSRKDDCWDNVSTESLDEERVAETWNALRNVRRGDGGHLRIRRIGSAFNTREKSRHNAAALEDEKQRGTSVYCFIHALPATFRSA